MVVYTNADFISLNEENLTYSVLVEDKGTPLNIRSPAAMLR